MTQHDTLYRRAFDSIGWASGLSAMPEVIKAEHSLSDTWIMVNQGKKTMRDFKIVLNNWEDKCRKAKTTLIV